MVEQPFHELLSKVRICSDKLSLGLPVGETGYIVMINPAPNTIFNYVVQIPALGRPLSVPDMDMVVLTDGWVEEDHAESLNQLAFDMLEMDIKNDALARTLKEGCAMETQPRAAQVPQKHEIGFIHTKDQKEITEEDIA